MVLVSCWNVSTAGTRESAGRAGSGGWRSVLAARKICLSRLNYSRSKPGSRRVLFVNANETSRPFRVAPLGLAFVATATENAGHSVRFLDLPQTAHGHHRYQACLRD